MRCLRNTLLMSSPEGREIIRLYNEYNSLILSLIKDNRLLQDELKDSIDSLIPFIKSLVPNHQKQF